MTEADIQAIVGFIRQWEATAPEVATPTRGGGGGPPWLRNNTTTTTGQGQSAATTTQGQGTGQGQGQGQGQAQQTTTAWWQTFDWRILLLIFGALSVSFTLIFMGFESLRKTPKK